MCVQAASAGGTLLFCFIIYRQNAASCKGTDLGRVFQLRDLNISRWLLKALKFGHSFPTIGSSVPRDLLLVSYSDEKIDV